MQVEIGALVIAVPIWMTFVGVTILYLYYAGRVTRHLKQFRGRAWARLRRADRQGPFYEVHIYPNRAFLGIIWSWRRFRDHELNRLVEITRELSIACILSMLASLATVYLFSN